MKTRLLVGILAMAAGNQFSFAGLAAFSPATQDVTPGTSATMDITLTAEQLPNFDSADAIVGSSNADISPKGWAYSIEWVTLSNPDLPIPGNCKFGPCPSSFIYVGGNTNQPGGYSNSILLGTLSVDTTGFAPGTYTYSIDFFSDGISNIARQGITEPLFGQGVIHVVPEPSMLAILGLGAAAFGLLKRRAANR